MPQETIFGCCLDETVSDGDGHFDSDDDDDDDQDDDDNYDDDFL